MRLYLLVVKQRAYASISAQYEEKTSLTLDPDEAPALHFQDFNVKSWETYLQDFKISMV